MALSIADIHYIAVILSALASMIIGFLWYGPIFGKMWMSMMGFTSKDMDKAKQKGVGKYYLTALIGSLITAFVLAYFIEYINVESVLQALQFGFWVWLGFIATVMLGTVLWEGKPVKLYFLNIMYQLVNIEVMAVILTLW